MSEKRELVVWCPRNECYFAVVDCRGECGYYALTQSQNWLYCNYQSSASKTNDQHG